jgi:hypothetical protein
MPEAVFKERERRPYDADNAAVDGLVVMRMGASPRLP